jgi:nitroimidazol reductase NimA-like FMN-containing flavoprotein (pyridoxamine 5'-phosphate oxidase superfamily)
MRAKPHERSLLDIDRDEALALAATAPVGRVVHSYGERLFVTPVNVALEGSDVLARTAADSELLAAARRAAPAAVEFDDLVEWSHSGWSVLIRGHLTEITDSGDIEHLLRTGPRPWSRRTGDSFVRLVGTEVTGRRIESGPGSVDTVFV